MVVMVLVGFGRVLAAIWRLPAMVGVVDVCRSLGKKWREKSVELKKISSPHQWCSKPPRGNQEHWDSSQGQMTMKQHCSLAFQRCFHFVLTSS
eukprot:scaffold11849_cov48-Cyclotella_meneghiniana.AAC.8